ncbi:DUF4132 domain-containing protein [Peterkaempfera griseoplana]|uniref:DUF4132 domain-containing protein n=1 Tax=Peterkaempfera griseoplana TaxID=66896 RepID=UPI0006E2230F|nr:DUF4132 domain-containing protein [Peterkaempfera griseoplana]
MGWVAAGDYEVALEGGKVVCRNASGRRLRSVPAKLKAEPAVVQLRALAEWLERHARECAAVVERWMIQSEPLSRTLLAEVWADPVWRDVLRDVVVCPVDGSDVVGFLRDADPGRGLGVVDLDGDTVRLDDAVVRIPHPVFLEDLADLREFAGELGVEQGVQQLYREVWRRPATADPAALAEPSFAGGEYADLRELVARATRLGYRVRGGYAVLPLVEDGTPLQARVWLGEYYEGGTETGPLQWFGRDGKPLPLGSVGPVAWSEGVRMAAGLYAGSRNRDEEQAA